MEIKEEIITKIFEKAKHNFIYAPQEKMVFYSVFDNNVVFDDVNKAIDYDMKIWEEKYGNKN